MLDMFKENGEYSLTRVIAMASLLAFIIASFYLMLNGKTWGNYDTFATATAGSSFTQIINKIINSKYNTVPGESGKPKGE